MNRYLSVVVGCCPDGNLSHLILLLLSVKKCKTITTILTTTTTKMIIIATTTIIIIILTKHTAWSAEVVVRVQSLHNEYHISCV